jgi:hypothetical protein
MRRVYVNKAKRLSRVARRLATTMVASAGYFLWAANVYAASMPPELIGEWARSIDYCGNEAGTKLYSLFVKSCG